MLLKCCLMAIIVLAAALTQSTSGFGFGIVFMAIMPFFFPYRMCIILSMSSVLALQINTIIKLHRYIQWKLVIVPGIFSIIFGIIGTNYMTKTNPKLLSFIMGFFLWILAFYMIFLASKIKLKKSTFTEAAAGSLGGFTGSVFAVGGPPMAAYYNSVIDSPNHYQGTIQTYFLINVLNILTNNFIHGNIHLNMIPFVILGIICSTVGTQIGLRISDHISMITVRKLAYNVMLLAGTYDIIKGIIHLI
ncbi:MAG: sulfite exporter TauE/SafE family protein [Firmicutes bacterium]|uniref:Probable membrane transporter protein n=1 Tax=Candidatus Gallilactobacillus intestinavium TaxID=2840838 RepID=A0A9D9E5Z8_9LACO|nr:sulfite exporter TauE/SafE family protein [Candidatus Gallilactobacillus intestinavium]